MLRLKWKRSSVLSELRETYSGIAQKLQDIFECTDFSERHMRLNVPVKGDMYPVMIYRGVSRLKNEREVVHVASPLLNVPVSAALSVAQDMDIMPIGGIRLLGELLHVHEAYGVNEVSVAQLEQCVRFIAAQAADMNVSFAGGE